MTAATSLIMSNAEREAIYAKVAQAAEEAAAEYAEVTRNTVAGKYRALTRAIENCNSLKALLEQALAPPTGTRLNVSTCDTQCESLKAAIQVMIHKKDTYSKVYDQFVIAKGNGDYDEEAIPEGMKDMCTTITATFDTTLTDCTKASARFDRTHYGLSTNSGQAPAAPGATPAAATPKAQSFKPHEGLRPSPPLPAQPTAKQVKDFIEQFTAYYKSGIQGADPAIQRAYLKANMSELLYDRVNAEDPNPSSAIDPEELRSGFFKYLLEACGEVDCGKLTKFMQLVTTRQERKGGSLEPWLTMLQRVQTLAKECEFSGLDHDTILALYCVSHCEDPELSKEFMKVPPPFTMAAYKKVALRYHTMVQQMERQKELQSKSAPEQQVSVNAVSQSKTKRCKCCNAKYNTSRDYYVVCGKCMADLKRPENERSRVSGYNCSKCNTKGNHVEAACTGKAFWPSGIDGKKGHVGSSANRGRGRDTNRSRRDGSQGRSSSATRGNSRRSPTPASKNFSANAVDNKIYKVSGKGPDMDTVNSRVSSVRIRYALPAHSFGSAAWLYDKTSHITEVLIYVYTRDKLEDKLRRVKQLARAKHTYRKVTPVKPWNPIVGPITLLLTLTMTIASGISQLFSSLYWFLYRTHDFILSPSFSRLSTLMSYMSHVSHTVASLFNNLIYPCYFNVQVNTVRVSVNGMSRSYNPFDTLKNWPGCLNRNRLHQDLDDLRVMVGCTLHEVNDCHTRHQLAVEACADTGAAMSVVSKDIIERLNAPTASTGNEINLTAANDAPMTTYGVAELRLFTEGKTFDINCLVTSAMTGRLLIGRPDLYKMRIISPSFPSVMPDKVWDDLQQQ